MFDLCREILMEHLNDYKGVKARLNELWKEFGHDYKGVEGPPKRA